MNRGSEMAQRNAQDVAAKWSRGIKGAKTTITAGVNAVTQSPTAKAADRADKYVAGVQAAVDSGKYQAGLRRVSLEDWKQAMLQKGLPRLDSGATQGESKMAAFMTEFLPFVDSAAASVRNMPDMTESDRDQRMLAMVQKLRQFRRSGTRFS